MPLIHKVTLYNSRGNSDKFWSCEVSSEMGYDGLPRYKIFTRNGKRDSTGTLHDRGTFGSLLRAENQAAAYISDKVQKRHYTTSLDGLTPTRSGDALDTFYRRRDIAPYGLSDEPEGGESKVEHENKKLAAAKKEEEKKPEPIKRMRRLKFS